jgi:DNA-binding transcriptional LysR family regulator
MGHLDQLVTFAQVVTYRGFAPASRALDIPKSRLSRDVAQLEERLGVRLIQRNSRAFAVTDVGMLLSEKCRCIMDDIEQAETAVQESISSPQGHVRVTAPHHLLKSWLEPHLPRFLRAHPQVQVRAEGVSHRVDLLAERIDIAIRWRIDPAEEPDVVVRKLFDTRTLLVAAPSYLAQRGPVTTPADLQGELALIGTSMSMLRVVGPMGEEFNIGIRPLLATNELTVALTAAIAGAGISLLPDHFCASAIASGSLVRLLPDWAGPAGNIQAAFPTRRGMVPGVRAFVDFLATLPPEGRVPGF